MIRGPPAVAEPRAVGPPRAEQPRQRQPTALLPAQHGELANEAMRAAFLLACTLLLQLLLLR